MLWSGGAYFCSEAPRLKSVVPHSKPGAGMIKSNLHPINNPVAYVGRSRMVVNSYDGMIGQFLICNESRKGKQVRTACCEFPCASTKGGGIAPIRRLVVSTNSSMPRQQYMSERKQGSQSRLQPLLVTGVRSEWGVATGP